jgi:iron-sulfur cluster assembly accessory protein
MTQPQGEWVTFDATAVAAVEQWRRDHPGSDGAMRVRMLYGGCSALRYEFLFDATREPDDLVCRCAGVDVLIDRNTKPFLQGATIHHSGHGFGVDRPGARGSAVR